MLFHVSMLLLLYFFVSSDKDQPPLKLQPSTYISLIVLLEHCMPDSIISRDINQE